MARREFDVSDGVHGRFVMKEFGDQIAEAGLPVGGRVSEMARNAIAYALARASASVAAIEFATKVPWVLEENPFR